MRYRKRPVVIEAVQLPPLDVDAPDDVVDWLNAPGRVDQWESGRDGTLIITSERLCDFTAHPGDWVIQNPGGKLYPCKPDVFASTYEPATEPETTEEPGIPVVLRADSVARLRSRGRQRETVYSDVDGPSSIDPEYERWTLVPGHAQPTEAEAATPGDGERCWCMRPPTYPHDPGCPQGELVSLTFDAGITSSNISQPSPHGDTGSDT